MRKFVNETNAAGLHITEASPMDDRLYVKTESSISALDGIEPMPSVMYDGMVIRCSDTGKEYIWVESEFGLMVNGFTYPEWYDDIQGQNYAGKKYNFVLFDKVTTVDLLYDNPALSGILIPNSKIPYRLLKDKEAASVILKSQKTNYSEIEFPDRLQIVSEGILIRFEPAPSPPELFKVTIY